MNMVSLSAVFSKAPPLFSEVQVEENLLIQAFPVDTPFSSMRKITSR